MDEVKIYKITNQITKKVYIGQTTKENLEKRLSQHSSSSDCPKLHNAIKLYGKESFKIELLDTCSKEQAVIVKEQGDFCMQNVASDFTYKEKYCYGTAIKQNCDKIK